MKKSKFYGVAINDADYFTRKRKRINGKLITIWTCPFYQAWENMIMRCYSQKYQLRHPSYIGCSVCEEWLTFSSFKSWMESQDWEGKQLDKDLLTQGNKVYSPSTCVFVDQRINSFTVDCAKSRGKHLIGVCLPNVGNKFQANCRNPITGKKEHLGYFADELSAHIAWKKRKYELACQLADSITDERLAAALRTRYLSSDLGEDIAA